MCYAKQLLAKAKTGAALMNALGATRNPSFFCLITTAVIKLQPRPASALHAVTVYQQSTPIVIKGPRVSSETLNCFRSRASVSSVSDASSQRQRVPRRASPQLCRHRARLSLR